MSSTVKSNDFTKAVMDRIKSDHSFKCGRSYSDLLIWTRLCAPLTNSEIFSFLPVVLRTIWVDEETSLLLFDRGAQKPDRFNVQSLSANLVCFRRTDVHNEELEVLKGQLSHLSDQFNTLSYTVFDVVERLTVLEEENRSLKLKLTTNGMISNPVSVEILPPTETKAGFIPIRFHDPKPLTCQIMRDQENTSKDQFVL